VQSQARVAAILGPTNTGKTHTAIERMLAHRTGVIGLPLRLLAREVYDRIVALRGPSVVALVTGEERIVPERAQYWVCTVEAMPTGMGCDFLAVDEIQLCSDPERGHVFTDRLLHARGQHETLFLGSDTMRGAIHAQVPNVVFHRQERFSDLTYTGSKKISRMPSRSAIVAFSVENVYAIAELLRRTKGGAAVVMGALSPRTRNAQVQMYQDGEVDTLVATDAIGMGLNLDIKHVAFAGTRKFDGRRMRDLWPNELAQIAGRAGRHTEPGTFGVTGEAEPLDDGVADAITTHRFAPVKKLQWRNADLDFGTARRLIKSLEMPAQDEWLTRAREADDLMALKAILADTEMERRLQAAPDVRLLWDVCRIPDFRGISHAEHATLLRQIFEFLQDLGRVPDDWLARQIARIDRTDGDLDTLSKRLAYIRTWTYVAQRKGWLDDESHWRETTRAVEDRLSDALHGALTQRFVDRRTSVLMRRLKQKERLVAEVNDKGEVMAEGQYLGRMDGFRFTVDEKATGDELKTLKSASLSALQAEFAKRADKLYLSPDTEIDVTEQGGLMWGTDAVGKVGKGDSALEPKITVFVDEMAEPTVAEKVERRLRHWLLRRINAQFEPLIAMRDDEAITGLARGVAFQLVESFGIIPRRQIADDIKALAQEERALLRKHGVRFGQHFIFMPALLKPAPTRLRLLLWALANDHEVFAEAPPPGHVTVPALPHAPDGYYEMAGYRKLGERALRIDMLERLADMIRPMDVRGGFEATQDMLSITGCTLEQFADLMGGLGFAGEKGERPKTMRQAKSETKPEEAAESETSAKAVAADEPPNGDTTASAETAASADPDAEAEHTAGTDIANQADTPGETASEPAPEAAETATTETPSEETSVEASDAQSEPEASPEQSAETAETTADAETSEAAAADPATAEIEVFYTFAWAPRRPQGRGRSQRSNDGEAPGSHGKGKPKGKRQGQKGPRGQKGDGGKRHGGGKGQGSGAKRFEARPPKKEKAIDPDNPFAAALMGLKDGK